MQPFLTNCLTIQRRWIVCRSFASASPHRFTDALKFERGHPCEKKPHPGSLHSHHWSPRPGLETRLPAGRFRGPVPSFCIVCVRLAALAELDLGWFVFISGDPEVQYP